MAERFDIPRAARPVSGSRVAEAFKELAKAQTTSQKAQKKLQDEVRLKQLEAMNAGASFIPVLGPRGSVQVIRNPQQAVGQPRIPAGFTPSSVTVSPKGRATTTFKGPEVAKPESVEQRRLRKKDLIKQLESPEDVVVRNAQDILQRDFGIPFNTLDKGEQGRFGRFLKGLSDKALDSLDQFFGTQSRRSRIEGIQQIGQ